MKKIVIFILLALFLSSCSIKDSIKLKDKDNKTYSITLSSDIQNGVVVVDKKTAKKGETVVVTAAPNDGYLFNYMKVLEEVYDTTTFIMPAKDVIVYVDFILVDETEDKEEIEDKETPDDKEEPENCEHNFQGKECDKCGFTAEYSALKEFFGYNIDVYTNDDKNPYNIDLDKYGSDVNVYFYEPNFTEIKDPYTNVNKTEFYSNYKSATTYEDAYYRTQHNLMSGDITDQYYLPTEAKVVENNVAIRATTANYILDTKGNYLGFVPNTPIGMEYIVFYKAAYISLNEVAAHLLAFGEVPANQLTAKSNTAKKQAVSLWGKYGRVNDGSFSGDPDKYKYQPLLPNIIGTPKIYYREMDFGTTGGYTCSSKYGMQKLYNNGSSIERGAARFVYVNDYNIDSIDGRYVFYTYNHYNDFQEYLNYHNGWGIRFGNTTAGNPYCGGTSDWKDSYTSPTEYPTTLLKKYSEIC